MNSPTKNAAFNFCETLPDGRLQFFVDASLLKSFSHCERYFYLHHVKNLRQKGFATGGAKPFPMAIGSWWSDVMEVFYNFLRDGRYLPSQDIQNIAVEMWAKHQLDLCALHNPDQFKSFGDLAGAVLMLQDYYTSQYLIDKNNWKIIAVEEGFGLNKEVYIGESDRILVYWIGKPDLVISENGRLTPVDHKTVSRVDGTTTNRYKPSTQMPGYVFSCEVIARSLGYDVSVDRCIVNICSRSRPSDNPRDGKKKPRFIRSYPNFNRDEIAEWRKGVMQKCERIAYCLRTDEWVWSETSCDNFYMRPCDYKKVDSTPPASRDIVLAADFAQVAPWVPYQVSKQKGEDE
jgi:hypothetical protein